MKASGWIVGVCIIFAGLFLLLYKPAKQNDETNLAMNPPVQIIPIDHASFVLTWGETTIYNDPTNAAQFDGQRAANIVLVSDIHGDHFSTRSLQAVVGSSTALVVPHAVQDQLTLNLLSRATFLKNGETTTIAGLSITAIPMYNLADAANANFHTKGRGNGYLLEKDGFRVYIAGDTAGTPEMRALKDIDIALVPMNLPYTMSVEEAADAVLAFKPRVVYPYHYRGQDGLSDVNEFKRLVNASSTEIEVVLADWYPDLAY